MRLLACALLPTSLLLLASPAPAVSFQRLLGFSGDFVSCEPWSVSADGRVVVGRSQGRAFRWENGVFTELAFRPGDQGEAFETSADGSVVVGYSTGPNGKEAFRWEAGVMTPLGDLPGGPFNSQADAVSADGTLIAGAGTTSSVLFSSFEAALFGAGGPTRLSDIAGGGPYFAIGGMSADASVMAGTLRGNRALPLRERHGAADRRPAGRKQLGLGDGGVGRRHDGDRLVRLEPRE